MPLTAEEIRLREADDDGVPWRRWGPYLAERQWGTVREDYSENGDAWSYFTHDQARSRAYKWGEDGIAGISDDQQVLCLALALWNGNDPILKERLFGLTNTEGNHGEDVKEYYFYLDATPTHSYLRQLYKYPQQAYPYADLVETNRTRSRDEMEYELLDTGVFDDDRYFDVTIEYAKADPDDLLMRITAENAGPDDAPLHLLPTLWFRNTWWRGAPKGSLRRVEGPDGSSAVVAEHPTFGTWTLYLDGPDDLLFCENETNVHRLWGGDNPTPYPKDGVGEAVVGGRREAVDPAGVGTKVAAHHVLIVPAGSSATVRVRLVAGAPSWGDRFGPAFDELVRGRRQEADAFYEAITPPTVDADRASVMRQALAGMIWTKQYYEFDLDLWLDEHQAHPYSSSRRRGMRNEQWFHMRNAHVVSMPDTWEYPWYAAWDLAFHTVALNMVDHAFAKDQVRLMLSEDYLHPSGQIPAYEWNFGDVNPPVHAWATLLTFEWGKHLGTPDIEFLRNAFAKLNLNFTWWVNRKDPSGSNVFEGGFLGLDNIGVFDRSSPLPTGGHLEQADGTAWMAFFSVAMLEIAAELSHHDRSYEDFVVKYASHFFWIAAAMDKLGSDDDDLWDDEDGFFYDVLKFPDGSAQRLQVRSMVGLLALAATGVVRREAFQDFPAVAERILRLYERHADAFANVMDPGRRGLDDRRLIAVVDRCKLERILHRMLDESRFLSPHGIRSLSRWHADHPFEFDVHGDRYVVAYEPAESTSGMFGGNSNWRGPVWFPVNMILVRALLQFHAFYGDDLTVEMPTGSGHQANLAEVALALADRLISTFTLDEHGRRPVWGGAEKFQNDPRWRDHLLFYEYFHGDNGAGLGASHQTGWTGVVARLIQLRGRITSNIATWGDVTPGFVPYRRPLPEPESVPV